MYSAAELARLGGCPVPVVVPEDNSVASGSTTTGISFSTDDGDVGGGGVGCRSGGADFTGAALDPKNPAKGLEMRVAEAGSAALTALGREVSDGGNREDEVEVGAMGIGGGKGRTEE